MADFLQEKNKKMDSRNLKCTICRTNKGLIHKYNLNICRRCFREVAPRIGFNKFS